VFLTYRSYHFRSLNHEEHLNIWNQRFNESTRGRIVGLLRRNTHTVEELAVELGVTDNAIRSQLTGLERDGLVRRQGLRRGQGKPSYAYALNPEFEPALSRAYIPLLTQLLRELGNRMSESEQTEFLERVGQRWAAGLPHPGAGLKSRVDAATNLLNELGGVVQLEEHDSGPVIRGYSCPLAIAVRENPRVCLAMETLLRELLGVEVRERCDRSTENVRCCFHIEQSITGSEPSQSPRNTPPGESPETPA
jgi:predicted ArsR family transcriptional regulator